MFPQHLLTPEAFALRFVELLPDYLPGVDTGAFEATDRRRCWNKTLRAVLTVMGKENTNLSVTGHNPFTGLQHEQSGLLWEREGSAVFAMTTGWGDRRELQSSLELLESFKCPEKLFIYSCSKWREAVHDQIEGTLLRYPYHILGRSRFCNHYTAAGVPGQESPVHPAPLWRASWRRHYAFRKVVDSYSAVLNAIPALSSQRTPKREPARNP